jgi:hypothetical protein
LISLSFSEILVPGSLRDPSKVLGFRVMAGCCHSNATTDHNPSACYKDVAVAGAAIGGVGAIFTIMMSNTIELFR